MYAICVWIYNNFKHTGAAAGPNKAQSIEQPRPYTGNNAANVDFQIGVD